jgi:hypothetical protein
MGELVSLLVVAVLGDPDEERSERMVRDFTGGGQASKGPPPAPVPNKFFVQRLLEVVARGSHI